MEKDLSDHGAVAYDKGPSGYARDLPDVDLSDHGAVAYDKGPSGYTRDLPDVDLSDHGAVAYDKDPSGYARDLPDVDLSDHGAVAYDKGPSGYARDLPDVDLSDHGAVAYEPKIVTWGTNDEEMVKQMNILMHATYSKNVNQVIPMLNAASLSKVIEYRYRRTCNDLENIINSLNKEDKERIGTEMYMDFAIIDSVISSNQNGLQEIFNADLYSGSQELSNIFGVLERYKENIDSVGVDIPLINGDTGIPVTGSNGNVITAQDMINYLMSKKEKYVVENSAGKKL